MENNEVKKKYEVSVDIYEKVGNSEMWLLNRIGKTYARSYAEAEERIIDYYRANCYPSKLFVLKIRQSIEWED